MAEKVGIKLTQEVSLKVEWAGFSQKMAKLVTDGFKAFHSDPISGVGAFGALIGVAKSVNQDVPVGARGLELILLCFAWSFDALRAREHLKEKTAKTAAKKAKPRRR